MAARMSMQSALARAPIARHRSKIYNRWLHGLYHSASEVTDALNQLAVATEGAHLAYGYSYSLRRLLIGDGASL